MPKVKNNNYIGKHHQNGSVVAKRKLQRGLKNPKAYKLYKESLFADSEFKDIMVGRSLNIIEKNSTTRKKTTQMTVSILAFVKMVKRITVTLYNRLKKRGDKNGSMENGDSTAQIMMKIFNEAVDILIKISNITNGVGCQKLGKRTKKQLLQQTTEDEDPEDDGVATRKNRKLTKKNTTNAKSINNGNDDEEISNNDDDNDDDNSSSNNNANENNEEEIEDNNKEQNDEDDDNDSNKIGNNFSKNSNLNYCKLMSDNEACDDQLFNNASVYEREKRYLKVINLLLAYLDKHNAMLNFSAEQLKFFLATHSNVIKISDFSNTNLISLTTTQTFNGSKNDDNDETNVNNVNNKKQVGKRKITKNNVKSSSSILQEYMKNMFNLDFNKFNQNDVEALRYIVENKISIPKVIYNFIFDKYEDVVYMNDIVGTSRDNYTYIQINDEHERGLIMLTNGSMFEYRNNQFKIPCINIERKMNYRNLNMNELRNKFIILDVLKSNTDIQIIDIVKSNFLELTNTSLTDRHEMIIKLFPRLTVVKCNMSNDEQFTKNSYICKSLLSHNEPVFIYRKSKPIVGAIGLQGNSIMLAYKNDKDNDEDDNSTLIYKLNVENKGEDHCFINVAKLQDMSVYRNYVHTTDDDNDDEYTTNGERCKINGFSVNSNNKDILDDNKMDVDGTFSNYKILTNNNTVMSIEGLNNEQNFVLFTHVLPFQLLDNTKLGTYSPNCDISSVIEYIQPFDNTDIKTKKENEKVVQKICSLMEITLEKPGNVDLFVACLNKMKNFKYLKEMMNEKKISNNIDLGY